MHYILYILQCKDQTLYCGITNNLEQRLKDHASGKGAKYTRGRAPFKLMYTKEYENKSAALKAEYQVKKLRKSQKSELIRDAATNEYAQKISSKSIENL